jgi:spermidine/putrescine transport system ATP-binding protein
MSIADTIVVMNHGVVEDMGAPKRIYRRPASRFAATFMGENNLLGGRIVAVAGDAVSVETALGRFSLAGRAEPGAAVEVAIRPEQLQPAATASEHAVPLGHARIHELLFQGAHWRARAVAGPRADVPLLLRLPPEMRLEVGMELDLFARPEEMVLLTR